MDTRYPKHERLKSRNTIEQLFAARQSVAKFPLRLAYIELPEAEHNVFGVSVSKKYFKRAHDRNYFKRVMREIYRKNKALLQIPGKSYAFMLLYQTKDRLPFAQIEELTIAAFEKFAHVVADSASS